MFLYGDEELLFERMKARDHFMPASLLRSQLETLEPLGPDESGVAVDVALAVEEVVEQVLAGLKAAKG